MKTAELSVGSQKAIKKDDTTEEIFGYFGINILDKHFPLYVYASDETCRCAPSNKVTLYNLLR